MNNEGGRRMDTIGKQKEERGTRKAEGGRNMREVWRV
jgi:hypothetical protein